MSNPDSSLAPRPVDGVVPFRDAVRVWFAISLQTFGGPAGQIAVMQRELVERRHWVGQRRFLHALGFCSLLPGPEAQQLAIYVGYLLNGVRGGLVAGTLFVLPGVVALLALSALYVSAGESAALTALFAGLAPAVLAIVAHALVRVGRRALARPVLVVLAVGSFVALSAFAVPFPVVVAASGLIGWLLGRAAPALVRAPRADDSGSARALLPDDGVQASRPRRGHAARVLVVGVLAWGVPVAAAAWLTGTQGVLTQQSLFFSGVAVVTFGGAYAVLAYVAQQAVEVYGWLGPGEMVRGLALAETTPGPLVMVVQFVAFLGAYRDPGTLDPWVAAVLASLLVTWVTFVPSFVLVLVGAPHIERLRGNHGLSDALTGIMAAVVGVIANLAVFFAVHTLFGRTDVVTAGPLRLELPVLATLHAAPLAIALVAGVLLFRFDWPVLRVLGVCAALGLAVGGVQALLD